MSADMEEQIPLDGMPVSQVVEPDGNLTTLQIDGPADAAFKTTRWGLENVRAHLANARAQRTQLNAFIADLVKQERYLARMARVADEFDKDQGEPPPEE